MDLAADYRALREGSGAVWLRRDFVQVHGPDAFEFLQGQLSQDLSGLIAGRSAWSLLLQPQGKVDALLRVSRIDDDRFVLDTDAGTGEAVIARLARFRLRIRADIESIAWRGLACRGPSLGPIAADVNAVAADIYGSLVPGVDLLGPAASVRSPDGLPEVGSDAYEVLRIQEGEPRMGKELTERTIPAEVAGMVERAVSFTKGCFTGQELVARIDSRGGHVPRQLRGLVIDGPVPAPGSPVVVDGKEEGSVTSAAPHPAGHAVALAYVSRKIEVPGDAVIHTVGQPPGVARIGGLPLLS